MGRRPVKLPRKTRILISRAIQTSSSNGLPGITGRGREWNSTDISSLPPERRQVSVLSACLALHVGLIRLSMKSKGERNGQKIDRKGKAEGRGGRVVRRIVRERVANISWRGHWLSQLTKARQDLWPWFMPKLAPFIIGTAGCVHAWNWKRRQASMQI